MKKILILTQSSTEGMNYKLAKKCQFICQDSVGEESEIKNCLDLDLTTIKDYDSIIMVVPEWNGSFPFMFKQIIDNSGYPSSFNKKNVLLIGTSDSTFGNIMGITHLQHILEWMGVEVFNKRVCIPNLKSYSFEEEDYRLISTIRKFLS
jgi:flavodoxin